MSWAGLNSNDAVTRGNLQDAVNFGVFSLKNSIIGDSSVCITKDDANYYVYIDTFYGPYNAKNFNELVVKGDLQASGGGGPET